MRLRGRLWIGSFPLDMQVVWPLTLGWWFAWGFALVLEDGAARSFAIRVILVMRVVFTLGGTLGNQ